MKIIKETIWIMVISSVVAAVAAMPFASCLIWGSDGHKYYFNNISEEEFCTLINMGYDTEYREVTMMGNNIEVIEFYALYRHTNDFHKDLDATGIKHYKSVNDAIACK
jgi:hypothetical protein